MRTSENPLHAKQTCSLCVRPMVGVRMTGKRAVAAHHRKTNRIGMDRRASLTLRLARQAIDSHASQG